MTTHSYATSLTWSGSTGLGYDHYGRTHRVVPRGAGGLVLSSDPAFLGDPDLANPELLLLAAASSCQLLSFLAVAARARLDVVGYSDEASAVMPEEPRPTRISEIVLRPRISLRGKGSERVDRLVRIAHDECFIANTLACEMRVEHTVEHVD